jgi:hypothetical protein
VTSFYSNGALINSGTDNGNIGSWGTALTIGNYGGGGGYRHQGKLSNILVYKNKGLTAQEVKQLYNATKNRFAPPPIVGDGLVLNLDAANFRSYAGTGTAWNDVSGNSNNGTLTNGPTYSSANGGSIVFDGVNDYVNVPYNSIINNSTAFTIDFWFKSNNIGAEQMLFSTSKSSPASGYHVEIYQSKFLFQVYPSTGFTSSTQTLFSNIFYNVSITYNLGNITYYINSIPAGTATHTFTPSDNDIAIGKFTYTAGSGYYLNGNIPAFRFYNRVLSAQEIQQNFNALRGRYGI